MWQAIDRPMDHVLREVTDFGFGKSATVSARIGENRWLVLSESISHADPECVDWQRMIGELFAGDLTQVVEAQ